jgi:hypothetical protein
VLRKAFVLCFRNGGATFCPAIVARGAGATRLPNLQRAANTANSHPDVVKFKPTALKLSKAYVVSELSLQLQDRPCN